AVLLTLALGIAANTAIFSVIEAVIIRPLPFGSPDRLVWLNGKLVPMTDEGAVSPPDFRDYRANNRTFEQIAAMGYVASPSNLGGDKPEQVLTTIASANFFDCLGIRPLLGRDFVRSDEEVKLPQVAILGYGVWKRDFGGDRNILGRTIRMDGAMLTVVGVLPADIPLLSEAQLWLPTPMLNPGMSFRLGHSLKAIGRMKSGVTLQQSQADLDAIALQLQKQYPDTNKDWWLRQRPLADVLIGPVRPALLLMWAAVGLLLLIACVNVANLLLARSISRQKEFALRTALGASRLRMLRQTLTESVTLSIVGGALGVIVAIWAIRAIHAFGPADVPRLRESSINFAVLAFTGGISLVTGVLFGLAPALQTSRGQFTQAIRESGRASAPASHKRLSGALVVAEIAISLTLLVSAGLLLKSFWRLIHVAPGFQTDHVVAAWLSLNQPAYGAYGDPTLRARFWHQFEERVSALPGVEAVGATSELPLTGQHNDDPFHVPGRSYGPSEFDDAQFRQVTPGYLSAMRIPLISGRWLDEHDNANSPGVVVVNQAFVKRFFDGKNALGQPLQLMGDPQNTRQIIGVVGNITHISLSEADWPEMYVPYAQFAPPTINVVVRAAANPLNLAAALQAQAKDVDKDVTLSAITSMDAVLGASVAQPRFSSELLSAFAALALLLAAIGLYGLMAYSVTQRRNEIGIRMALGARREDVLKLILRQGSRLTLAGIVIGLITSLGATRLLSSMLFSVTSNDPETFIAVAFLLVGVALGACYVPARRAAKVDPMVALRYE
ncbi:MAG TPA: ABC transporter permease, partial [Candidatus Sulfotelmatobacter sp.]|nr:ABC transporter permease [Candidatus Sulfotelmatobacter sp.]